MVSVVPWPMVFHRFGISKKEVIPYGSAYGSDKRARQCMSADFFTSWPPAPGNGKEAYGFCGPLDQGNGRPMIFVVPRLNAMENLWFRWSPGSRQWKTYRFCKPLTEGNGKPMVCVIPRVQAMENLWFCHPLSEGNGKAVVFVIP